MGAEKKTKQVKISKGEKARRAEALKAMFEQSQANSQTQSRGSLLNSPDSEKSKTNVTPTPTPTLTELTESQKNLRKTELTRTLTANGAVQYERPRESTSLRTVVSHQPYSPAKRMDRPVDASAASRRSEKSEETQSSSGLGLLLIIAAALLGLVGYWSIQTKHINPSASFKKPAVDQADGAPDRQRVDFYRYQLGHRLNRQRVDVEVENYTRAPDLSPTDEPRASEQKGMMRGLPLAPETIDKSSGVYSSRFMTSPISPDHPDARVQYGLQEEEHRDEFSRQANRDYVKEFIRNAEREGLKVKIDSDYNVIDVTRDGQSLMRAPGSKQGPAR